jgi:hypothetical protein
MPGLLWADQEGHGYMTRRGAARLRQIGSNAQ